MKAASLDYHNMSYNNSTTFCRPPPVSPIASYDQASSQNAGGRSTDQYSAAPVNGNSYHFVSDPPTSPHWVSPTPSLGNPFSFDSAFSHSSYLSGYASPVSPNRYPAALNLPDERPKETEHGTVGRSVYDVANEDIRDYKSNEHLNREHGASNKALMLLQETVGIDVVSSVVPIEFSERNSDNLDYDVMSDPGQYQKTSPEIRNDTRSPAKDDSNDAKCFKNGFDVVRERGANLKALALLEQTVGYDISDVAKATSVYLHKPTLTVAEESYSVRQQLKAEYKAKKRAEKQIEEQKMLKEDELFEANQCVSNGPVFSEEETSSKHLRAKMLAEFKAKKKLEKYAGGARVSSPEPPCNQSSTTEYPIPPEAEIIMKPYAEAEILSNGRTSTVATVPDEDLSSKQIRAKIIAEYKAKKKLDKTVGYKVAENESLAETSRVPTKCDSNTHDPETIAGMKCEIDIERENMAKKRALQLLNDRPGLMA